jgi:hypothetical protein
MSSRYRIVQKVEPSEPHLKKLYANICKESQRVAKARTLAELEENISIARVELNEVKKQAQDELSAVTSQARVITEHAQNEAKVILKEAKAEAQKVMAEAVSTLESVAAGTKELEADQAAFEIRQEALEKRIKQHDRNVIRHEESKTKLTAERKELKEWSSRLGDQEVAVTTRENAIPEVEMKAQATLDAVLLREGELAQKESIAANKLHAAQGELKSAEKIRLEARKTLGRALDTERQANDKVDSLKAEETRLKKADVENRKEAQKLKAWENRVEMKITTAKNRGLIK